MNWRGVVITVFAFVPSAIAASPCDDILISKAWIREPPPLAKVAAGYATLENVGDQNTTISRVESSCCANVAMHETIADGDQMRMSHIENLQLPAHDGTRFEPGAAHLMLMSPSAPMRAGEFVEIEFFCVEGGSFRANFEVLRVR